MDREKVVKEFEEHIKGHCPSDFKGICRADLMDDVLTILKEQQAEIAFLKGAQLHMVKNMDEQEIGEAVGKMLGIRK